MIRVEQVSKTLRGKLILDSVNLVVPDASVVVVLGPSGAGKTTLLKIIAGIMTPDSGRVIYDAPHFTKSVARPEIGFVFQNGALFDFLNVFENLALPLRERAGFSDNEINRRVQDVLRRVGFDKFQVSGSAFGSCQGSARFPSVVSALRTENDEPRTDNQEVSLLSVRQLSGGMMRLVAIARALIYEPKYIFFDEPTSGLDPLLKERVCGLIRGLPQQWERSAVVVTHDLELAEKLTGHLYILKAGKLISSAEIKKEDYEPADA
jgi:phospholipid/cholesterol/gamma-HCH transport system ATP-binding protein